MTLADVYEYNAKECREAAERTDNVVHRVRLLKAAREWWAGRGSAARPPAAGGSTAVTLLVYSTTKARCHICQSRGRAAVRAPPGHAPSC